VADEELVTLPSTSCDAGGALLCESFDAPFTSEYSTWYGEAQIATIQDCLVNQGAGALRYKSSGFGYAQTRMRLSSSVAEGPLHARFYAYFPSEMTIPKYLALFELWTIDDSPNEKIGVDALGDNQLEFNVAGTASSSAVGVLKRDRWLCIELGLDLSADSVAISLSVDGETVITADSVATSLSGPFSVAVVESVPSEESLGVEHVFDELVIATEPIGCR
jgi:hypothetical protein